MSPPLIGGHEVRNNDDLQLIVRLTPLIRVLPLYMAPSPFFFLFELMINGMNY